MGYIPVWTYAIHKNWNNTIYEYDSTTKYRDGMKLMNEDRGKQDTGVDRSKQG